MVDRHKETTEGLEAALGVWESGIAAGDLEMIAGAFTPDALFKGLRPEHAIGRDGVKEYYGAQEPGLTVDYRVLHLREIHDDAVIALVRADFVTGTGDLLRTHITIVLQGYETGWLISHYHVSPIS